jgi:putative PEP-CTERM system TPR-repeat lipoprotein
MASTRPSRSTVPSRTPKITPAWWPLVLALCLIAVASAGCSKATVPTRDELLARANDFLAAEQYGKAERDYREVLRLAPDDPVAVRQLAIIYYEQNQLSQAYLLLKKSAEIEPGDPEVQRKLGLTLLTFGEYQQAQEAAAAVLEKQPGDEQALIILANTAIKPEDFGETRKLIESFRYKVQDGPGFHLALGSLALRQKDLVRAEGEFTVALKLDPNSAWSYMALATLYWELNDLKAADQAFKRAADLSSLRSPMRLRYAEFKLRTGAIEEAQTILGQISSKYPDYLPPRVSLMQIACTEHEDEDCTSRVQNILAQDPINYGALFEDGVLNLAKGNDSKELLAKAIHEFEYLSNTYTRNPQVRYQLALAYLASAKNATLAVSRDALEAAETRLTEAVKLDPYLEPAVLSYAELKIRKGSSAAASDALTEFIEARPQSTRAYYLLASAYLTQGRQERAVRTYRQMTELFPMDPQPPFLIGSALLAQSQPAEARKAFEKSAEIAPDYLPPTERLVDLDIADKQYSVALERVQRQIDKDPKQAQPWALRAKIYLAQRDLPHAEADFLKAIELDPTLEPAYMLLAQIYVASNRQDEAIKQLDVFTERSKSVPALMQLAAIHTQLRNFPAARDDYEKLLTVAANFAPALNNLAVLYSDRFGQIDKAYELAKKAREAAPNDARTADTLGWVLVKRGYYDNALELLQDSATKLPGEPDIQFHLGTASYMLGEEATARAALQKAVDATEDFPGKDEAQARLELLAINLEKSDTAVRAQLENYLRERPNDPGALARRAALQQGDGNEDRAINTYEKLLAEDPYYAPATRQLALLYSQRLKDDSNAADISRAYDWVIKARQAYPDDQDVAKTLGILSYRRGYYPRSAELLKEVEAKRPDDAELRYYLGQATIALRRAASSNRGANEPPPVTGR